MPGVASPAIALALAACGGPEAEVQVLLDGPAELTVRELGPVRDAPHVVDEAGAPIDGVALVVAPSGVAQADGDGVIAVGPGDATVTADVGGRAVSWVLHVQVDTTLHVVALPAEAAVGDHLTPAVTATVGGREIPPPGVSWACAPATRCAPDAGGFTVTAPGRLWVTAKSSTGAAATAELVAHLADADQIAGAP